jgi:hypothetical protein
MKDVPPALRELGRFGTEPANHQFDAVPVLVRQLSHDFGITLFSNSPTFVRGTLDVQSSHMGAIGEPAREHFLECVVHVSCLMTIFDVASRVQAQTLCKQPGSATTD